MTREQFRTLGYFTSGAGYGVDTSRAIGKPRLPVNPRSR